MAALDYARLSIEVSLFQHTENRYCYLNNPTKKKDSQKLSIRLYWEKGYFWQETYEETFWCSM